MSSEEIFPIVNSAGETIGRATRKECHSGSMLLHPVVHLHIVTPDNKIFLQQRSFEKDIQPGKWDTAVGGHIDYGETVIEALHRECFEELGVSFENAKKVIVYEFQSSVERELINVFSITVNEGAFNVTPDSSEVIAARFWTREEVECNLGKGLFTPNFEQEFNKIKQELFMP